MSNEKQYNISYDIEFDTLYENFYSEKSSCFSEPKKLNHFKTSYLSHNTLTFLLYNRKASENLIKRNKNILSHLLNRDY